VTFYDEYRDRLVPWSDVQYAMPRLHESCRWRERPAILELGVRSGQSTSAFLGAAELSGGHVWSVDCNVPDVPAHWLGSDLWTFTQGDDLAVPLPPVAIDVVFIDTTHTFEHTLAELRRFVPLVTPGGTVLLHDTLSVVDDDQRPFPVTTAIATFCAETGRGWTEHGGQYGLGEIARPNG
jgi:cephalosporin hydroxylase